MKQLWKSLMQYHIDLCSHLYILRQNKAKGGKKKIFLIELYKKKTTFYQTVIDLISKKYPPKKKGWKDTK